MLYSANEREALANIPRIAKKIEGEAPRGPAQAAAPLDHLNGRKPSAPRFDALQ
jgi:hypothetical protein